MSHEHMLIELHLIPPLCFDARGYRDDEDDVRSMLMDVCGALDPRSKFRVSGFGQERWPVDVSCDLGIFLEQLPYALRRLQTGQAAQIDLYEQGVERSIEWVPDGTVCVATCRSWTDWKPEPSVETVAMRDVIEMMSTALETFLSTMSQMASGLLAHPWIVEWRAGLTEV
ncbi:hypothetical protein [Mitsuaria sp. 7]|uniref:hypothetical protein n=1 Tax=Mitsuaria sp. 7 TaxID=1658665 RepID=UPI0012F7B66C|nr:hypothetical protein [Mitsuaria sp. 7]